MSKHTPGPWEVGKMNTATIDGFPLNRIPISGSGYAIAAVWAGDARRRGPIMGIQEMHEANAHLVAAAPELLAASKDGLAALRAEIVEGGGCDHSVGICWCSVIRVADSLEAAIIKAEGHT